MRHGAGGGRGDYVKTEYARDEIAKILGEYGISDFDDYRRIDSSHGDGDVRQNYIVDRRYVLRINSAKVMTEERLTELNGLIGKYNKFGIRAPYFIRGTDGTFLRSDNENNIYLSEYLDAEIADDFLLKNAGKRATLVDERLTLVARYAERYKNQQLSKIRSMYSIFELSPYDELLLGIDEKQDNLNELAATLRDIGEAALADQFAHENENIRAKLIGVYQGLPACVFQGDESFSNVCVDADGHICGLFDFNMSGTDVNANYLANLAFQGRFYYTEEVFDTHDADWVCSSVLESFHAATGLIQKAYHFTETELEAYYLYARLVMFFGYVNVSAFRWYLGQPKCREECINLLHKLLQVSLR